jgi:hypothetical protein
MPSTRQRWRAGTGPRVLGAIGCALSLRHLTLGSADCRGGGAGEVPDAALRSLSRLTQLRTFECHSILRLTGDVLSELHNRRCRASCVEGRESVAALSYDEHPGEFRAGAPSCSCKSIILRCMFGHSQSWTHQLQKDTRLL